MPRQDQIEKERRRVDQVIDAVENAAVTGRHCAAILDLKIHLDGRKHNVADKGTSRNNGAHEQRLHWCKGRDQGRNRPGNQRRDNHTPGQAGPVARLADLYP